MEFLRRLLSRTTAHAPAVTSVSHATRHLRYGQISDVGRVRETNQDACLAFVSCEASRRAAPDFGLFIVADGMGGHEHGERASGLTARVIADYMADHAFLPMLSRNGHYEVETLAETLNDAIRAANAAVSDRVPNGGTTLTAAAIYGAWAYLTHVGDSRAYLVADAAMAQLTRDHSLVQRLIELKQLTPEQAAEHPHRNVLYRAVGQTDYIELDSSVVHLPPAARLLLCSDGLWSVVPEATIAEIVATVPDPQQACVALAKEANAGGGPDNVTAVVIHMPG
ncbi:MAG: protein phosphatase 2C domain-containing protein [Anaerolineae bacterium]